MASITIDNSSITTTSNTVTINYTTDVTLSQVELTKDSSTWIKARTFSQTSASFDISSWSNGTYSNCKLRITYETVTNYGQIVLSTSTISLNEGSAGSFTVKLDSAPTSNQVVNLSVNNSNCSLNKNSLTFTPSNYNTTQSVTIAGAHDSGSYSDKASTITASSDNVSSKTISVTIKNIDTPETPETPDPITLTLASSMSCNKGETFSITYSTNVEATKHELSMDGGNSYFQIYPTSNGTSYTYSHEAINDTTWNPVSRTIRVTDANGNTATGTISVTIVESEPEVPTNYTITPQLTHCTCSNTATSITPNSSYSATINANSGYTLSSVTVTMGGTDITSTAVSGSSISISSVTGNIVITANVADYSSGNTTTVTLNLTNCISINAATTALMGEGYTTTIIAKDGYTLGNIKVTLGGEDVSSAVVKEGGTISIGFLRGPLVITANATGGSTGGSTIDLTATILNMQYASAHEALPNAPIDDVWKDKPRQGKGLTIPTQSCTECASGTHTASESYSAGSLWSTVGQWGTIFKIKDTELVENVGVEITDFKMWRYNVNTNQWVLINDTFDYGAFYYETFWDDGSAPLNDHKILSSDKKTYKCLMDSATAGRCFHPFSTQKKWADYGFTSNPSYIVSQMKARLIVWDESGADNRASANLCMDVGGDYWIRQGASFDSQWRHNSDIAIGYYKKITSDWQYVYMTTCPQDWDKGFPCDK